MKKIILTIVFGMILLIGVVGASNSLDNLEGITVPLNVVAGDTFAANFSFDYLEQGINEDNSPLIIKLDFISNNLSYPVWKGDFNIEGIIKKCTWTILGTCILPKEIDFTCSEIAPLTIINPIDTTTINEIPNGTFYCYNAEGDLNLNEHDEVFLNVTSHPALYPGEYNLIAQMFYLNDTTAPIVLITNKNDFENKYYRELNNIEVSADISDGRNISGIWGIIITPTQNISLEKGDPDGISYSFTKVLPSNIPEGIYELKITAKDSSENIGYDNVTLMIDRTGPTIELISPNVSEIYSEILPIKVNVTDEKSDVDSSNVYYRLREMNGTNICPETGEGTWNCYNSGWLQLTFNSESGFYEKEVNTTEINLNSGEYWLDVKAQDILGNENYL